MSEKAVNFYKKCGQTPLECINQLKNKPNMADIPITYAGRLDPLAEGVLIALVGDECMKKDKYLALSKEYELTVLFGFSTDSYDLLGKITKIVASKEELLEEVFTTKIQEILPRFIGNINQSYPPYSSKPINGKPLFQWAREGKLDEIEIPSHKVHVDSIDILNFGLLKKEDLHKKIKEAVTLVKGDFRQDEILKLWEQTLQNSSQDSFATLTLKISCGSGFYARVLAHELGRELGVPALALHILRTKVGDYSIQELIS